MLLNVLQLVGIGVFAASGALAAVRARLDVFGVAVVGLTTALGGGLIRDVLLGVHPPTALTHWPFLAVPAVVSLGVFWLHPQIARLRRAMLLADAVGLGLFVTSSTATALALGVPRYDAWLIGMTAGIGGGVLVTCCCARSRWCCAGRSTRSRRWPAVCWWWSGTGCGCRPGRSPCSARRWWW